MASRYILPSDDAAARAVVTPDIDGMNGMSEATAPLKFPDFDVEPADPDAFDPIDSDRIQIAEHTYSPGGHHHEHAHDDIAQVYYFLAGTTEVTVGDESDVVGPGSVAYMPAETPHSTRVVGDEDVRLLIISVPADSS